MVPVVAANLLKDQAPRWVAAPSSEPAADLTEASYPPKARRRELSGTVEVLVARDETGRITGTRVVARDLSAPGLRGRRPVFFETTLDAASITRARALPVQGPGASGRTRAARAPERDRPRRWTRSRTLSIKQIDTIHLVSSSGQLIWSAARAPPASCARTSTPMKTPTHETAAKNAPASWRLQDAKAQFSAVVDQALRGVPQHVTRRGERAVVVLSAQDFDALQRSAAGTRKPPASLIAHLLAMPRSKEAPKPPANRLELQARDVDLS